MKKIRTGNDIHFIWTITKNDEILESIDDLNLEGAEVLLIDSFNHPATFEYAITTIDENTAQVVGTFFGKDQKTQGKYRLLLVKNKGEEGMITLDFVDAFILTCVSKFGVMSGNDESSITTATIELNSQFNSYNGSPDMTGYYTKEECDDLYVHKNDEGTERIDGYKIFTGQIDFVGSLIALPAPDEIGLGNGKTLEEYVSESGGGGGGDLTNYYTKSETQNYVSSRIVDNALEQSHADTWSSYAISDYVNTNITSALPQTYKEDITVGGIVNVYGGTVKENDGAYITNGICTDEFSSNTNLAGTQALKFETDGYRVGQAVVVDDGSDLQAVIGVYKNYNSEFYRTSLTLNKNGMAVEIGDNGEKIQFPEASKIWLGDVCVGDITTPNYLGNVFDNFANCTPVHSYEYTISSASYRRLFTFTNSSEDLREQTGYCEGRITITNYSGTISGKYSFLVRLNGQIQGWLQCQDLGTTTTTRGLYQMVLRTPNAANNGSDWMVDIVCNGANATDNLRNVKLEIISKSDNCTIVANDNDVTYANTAPVTLQNNGNNMFYMSSGGALQINANTANSALQLSNRLTKYLNVTSNQVGEALASGDIIFVSQTDNKLYNIANTTQPIDCDGGVMQITAAQAANANATYNYMATICGNSFNLNGMGTTYPSTWTTGRPLYLKCTYPDANGDIYSLNELTLDKSAGGFTYYLLGRQTTTSQRIALNTESSQFYSLNANGKLTHINGMELA